jgi:hypothetical protein
MLNTHRIIVSVSYMHNGLSMTDIASTSTIITPTDRVHNLLRYFWYLRREEERKKEGFVVVCYFGVFLGIVLFTKSKSILVV